jgi:DNA-binding NtrC family response regulator
MTRSILVIDDDRLIRLFLKKILSNQGYRVDASESGLLGLEYVKKRTYGLIFIDWAMPGLSGTETLSKMRAAGITAPVYIITGYFNDYMKEVLQNFTDNKMPFNVIQKPLEKKQILSIVSQVFQKASMGEERIKTPEAVNPSL